MRLAAKFKLEMNKVSKEKLNLGDYLQTKHFEAVVLAALRCSKQNILDEEDLSTPSNAIKLGYDIKRMASAKLGKALVDNDESRRKEADVLKLMEMEWGFE